MTTEHPNRHVGNVRAKKTRVTRTPTESAPSPAAIDVVRSGDWMPSEDLRETALAALAANGDVSLNLHGLDHLDASALQILLALNAEQRKRNQNLQLINASPRLRQWFEFAGVVDLLFREGAEQQ